MTDEQSNTEQDRSKRSAKSFDCVSLQPGLQACTAAWLMIGDRFLLNEVPKLPVVGCDFDTCDCRFNQHEDRREPGERRTDLPDGGEAHKLRKNAGRRHDDK
ncbi:MAG: hypothetical protein ACSHXK_07360 [Oceanococcus sp.]